MTATQHVNPAPALLAPELLPAESPEALGLSSRALARAGDALRAEIARGRLPGAVALIARHGRVGWFEAFGRLGPDADTPMTRDAIFRIYSMTKPLVSLAAMMLVEEGRLMLDDPLERHLPEFAAQMVGRPDAAAPDGLRREPLPRPITLQDLLRHTSGMTYEFLGDDAVHRAYQQAKLSDPRRTNAQLCAVLAGLPLLHAPGERWGYGRSTDVLGRVIEVVSGVPLGEFLRERILGPLGMVDTAFHVAPGQHHRIAEPYPVDPDTGEAVRLLDPRSRPALEMGGGGLMSTAADYLRFLQMMLDGGRSGDRRLVSRKTVELMTADHLGGIAADSPLLPAGHGFGLGFAVRKQAGLATAPGSVGQYFWGGIAATTFWVDPKEGMAAILLAQAPGRRDYLRQLFRALAYAAIDD
ncbi:serine hydrolase domain-containing protein [Zeimonas arvi]|uniref:Beta-lactamase family protein n=1 Tax=Zeimonas arvi TaxID=2498847 RepID=A0A5C8NRW0_9BURK|nr:serine hydrolase domain-containing protein [Zeimonas arvi]TXL63750.1 beta-lactamase family protein [Zeimonas arvi]